MGAPTGGGRRLAAQPLSESAPIRVTKAEGRKSREDDGDSMEEAGANRLWRQQRIRRLDGDHQRARRRQQPTRWPVGAPIASPSSVVRAAVDVWDLPGCTRATMLLA